MAEITRREVIRTWEAGRCRDDLFRDFIAGRVIKKVVHRPLSATIIDSGPVRPSDLPVVSYRFERGTLDGHPAYRIVGEPGHVVVEEGRW